MSATFRAIPIQGCDSCHYSIDWSSAGLSCQKYDPNRDTFSDSPEDRKKSKTSVPNWCPLPLVKYNDN